MQIEAWLKQNNKTREWLSNKSGIQYDRLCHLIRGEQNILLMEAWEVYHATGKKVKLVDWVDKAWDDWFSNQKPLMAVKVNRRKAKK